MGTPEVDDVMVRITLEYAPTLTHTSSHTFYKVPNTRSQAHSSLITPLDNGYQVCTCIPEVDGTVCLILREADHPVESFRCVAKVMKLTVAQE